MHNTQGSTSNQQPTLRLLNFSHPLTDLQVAQVEAMTGQSISQIINIGIQFNDQLPFVPQLQVVLNAVGLTAAKWRSEPFLIVPPSLNSIAVLLLAELHGRMGYFPTLVRMRPIVSSVPKRYEVAELLDLQDVRERARHSR